MTVVRYQPWTLFDRLQRQLDQALSVEAGETADGAEISWIPQVDIREEPERFVVLADVPGVEPKDIHITVDKGVLTIRGEKHARETQQPNGWQRLERRSGSFLRRFTLPEGANPDAIAAKHVHGVLEVTIPKQPQVRTRRIEVEAA
jgi:HSP20 family protein